MGDPDEAAPAQPVHPGVADVDHRQVVAVEGGGGDGRAHPVQCRVVGGEIGDQLVGVVDPLGDPAQQVLPDRGVGGAGQLLVEGAQPGHGDGGGEVAGSGTPHAVGDHQQVRGGVAGVLVVLADQPDLGVCRVSEGQRHTHGSSFRIVRPILISSAGPMIVAPVIRRPFTNVPLVEPRSSR
ncbi:hypothetical protein SDC9_135939 [bioreactor metagenome]|uniref:Uncharacterized protein n=1 Tax=bioreactor metagenome TaxID=1076179 RepID=A0A645DHZ4_9ZZZZ